MEQRVKGPAIGLIVLAGVAIAWMLLNLLGTALGFASDLTEHFVQMMPAESRDQMREALAANAGSSLLTYVTTALGLAANAFIIYAAMQMMKLKAWPLAITASILVMIPCFTSCCCVIGIGIGIWSLVVLLNRDVKAAFEAAAATPM